MKTRAAAIATVAIATAALLAACGGSSSESASPSVSPSALPSMSALPSPEPTMASEPPILGNDPATWAPVEITQDLNNANVRMLVGQTAIFTDLPESNADNLIVVVSSKKGVVKVTQQSPDGTTFAGLTAKKKGKTTITVWDGKPNTKKAIVVMQFTVKVRKATPANIAKAQAAIAGAIAAEESAEPSMESSAEGDATQ